MPGRQARKYAFISERVKCKAKIVKALLLAAGLGSRLRPITNHIPKCLVPIDGKPLLSYWLDALFGAGIDSILINVHYLSDQVTAFVTSRSDRDRITIVEERTLLGTAATLKENVEFFSGESSLVIHADNFCTASVPNFINQHRIRPECAELTMMTFWSAEPKTCGIVVVDEQGIVREFHEKVESPPGNIANAAIYVFEDSVLQYISQSKDGELIDISKDLIPKYLGRIYATPADGVVVDVGTPAKLERAQSYARNLHGT